MTFRATRQHKHAHTHAYPHTHTPPHPPEQSPLEVLGHRALELVRLLRPSRLEPCTQRPAIAMYKSFVTMSILTAQQSVARTHPHPSATPPDPKCPSWAPSSSPPRPSNGASSTAAVREAEPVGNPGHTPGAPAGAAASWPSCSSCPCAAQIQSITRRTSAEQQTERISQVRRHVMRVAPSPEVHADVASHSTQS
jgi:hypothetical protein